MGRKRKKKVEKSLTALLIIAIIVVICYMIPDVRANIENYLGIKKEAVGTTTLVSFDLNSIPEYSESPFVYINNNKPYFTESDYTTKAFENYSELDNLGRCGVAYANICKEIMPKENETRESINKIRPTGWNNAKYEGLVDGDYLYNRCHLIGWQLSGENANEKNLITGTRYMNVEGMLPFENMIDDYFEKKANKNNHVLYRVTPIFKDSNLVASGVELEAYSVEDNGVGVCFNVYVYNVQPNIKINYLTGESVL